MPLLTPSKHIGKTLAAYVRVAGFSGTGASNNVTTAIGTALSTAGDGGVSVPSQISASNGEGIITTGATNRIEVYAADSKLPLVDGAGNEIYGRLTETGGVYTLTYYSLVSGVETAYTLPATTIDFEFAYRFTFAKFPTDGTIAVRARNISDDPASSGGARVFTELLTPTAQNTLPNVTNSPLAAANFFLIVNQLKYDALAGGAVSVNTSTKAVTWSAATAGFNLETSDRVVAVYFY